MFNFDTTLYQPLMQEISTGKAANGADFAKSIIKYYDISVKQALPIVAGTSTPFTSGKKQLAEKILRIGFELQETKILKANIKGLVTDVKLIQQKIKDGYKQIQSYTEQIKMFVEELSNIDKLIVEVKDVLVQEYQSTLFDIKNALKDINVKDFSNFLTQREIDFLQRLSSLTPTNFITIADDINSVLFKVTYNVNAVDAYAISKIRILVSNLYELALGSFNPLKMVDSLSTFLTRVSNKSTLVRLIQKLPAVQALQFQLNVKIKQLKLKLKSKLYEVKEKLKKKLNKIAETIKARYKELVEKRGSTKLKFIKSLGEIITLIKQEYKRIKEKYVRKITAYVKVLKKLSNLILGIPELLKDVEDVINMFIQNNIVSPPSIVSLADIQVFNQFIHDNKLDIIKPFVQKRIESGTLSLAVFMEYVFDNRSDVDRVCHKIIYLIETVLTLNKELHDIEKGIYNETTPKVLLFKRTKYSIYDFSTLLNIIKYKVQTLIDKALTKMILNQKHMKLALNKNRQSVSATQNIMKSGMTPISISQSLSKMEFQELEVFEKKRLALKLKNIYNYILYGLKLIQNAYETYKSFQAGQVDIVDESLRKVIDAYFGFERNPNPKKKQTLLQVVDDISMLAAGIKFMKLLMEEGGSEFTELLQRKYNVSINSLTSRKIIDFMSASSALISLINTSSEFVYDLREFERKIFKKNVALVEMGYKFIVGFDKFGQKYKGYDETFLKKLSIVSRFSVIDFIIRKVTGLISKVQLKLNVILDKMIILPIKRKMTLLLERWKKEQSGSLKMKADRKINIQAKVMTVFFNLALQTYWLGATWQQPDTSMITVTYPGMITKPLKGLVTGDLIKEISRACESQMRSLMGIYIKITPAGIPSPPVPWNGFN